MQAMRSLVRDLDLPSRNRHLKEFVAEMRVIKPFGEIEWENDIWDVTNAPQRSAKRSHDKKRYSLHFMQYDGASKKHASFPKEFADFSKAVICYRHDSGAQTANAHRVSLRALRYLFRALTLCGKVYPWQLAVEHFHAAESMASDSEALSSAYRVSQRLEEIAKVIDRRQLAPIQISYRATIRKVESLPITSKMLGQDEIDTCGNLCAAVSASSPSNPADVILMRIIDIMLTTGMRIGEVLTLPAHAIVNDAEGFGIRYWPEKGGRVQVKRVATPAIELSRRAIEQLVDLCSQARRTARWLHDNPGRIKFPAATSELLDYDQVAAIVGWSRQSVQGILARYGVEKVRRRGVGDSHTYVSKSDLETLLVSFRDDRPIINAPGVYRQELHESLIVICRHQLKPDANDMPQLAEPVSIQQVYSFLGVKSGTENRSAFERYDVRLPSGDLPRVTTHQIRHWVNTIALRGGMNELELARWMGRRQIRDNRAYDHRSSEERAEEARQLIREDKLVGAYPDAYKQLRTTEEREQFLNTHVTAALVVPAGGCLHDWAQSPCTLHLNCLSGCTEYTRTIGSTRERSALLLQREQTTGLLHAARREMDDETCGANNWVAHLERQLKNIDAALSLDAHLFVDTPTED